MNALTGIAKSCSNPDCPHGPGLLPASKFNLHWAGKVPYLRARCKVCQAEADRVRRAAQAPDVVALRLEQGRARHLARKARRQALREAA